MSYHRTKTSEVLQGESIPYHQIYEDISAGSFAVLLSGVIVGILFYRAAAPWVGKFAALLEESLRESTKLNRANHGLIKEIRNLIEQKFEYLREEIRRIDRKGD